MRQRISFTPFSGVRSMDSAAVATARACRYRATLAKHLEYSIEAGRLGAMRDDSPAYASAASTDPRDRLRRAACSRISATSSGPHSERTLAVSSVPTVHVSAMSWHSAGVVAKPCVRSVSSTAELATLTLATVSVGANARFP